MTGADPYLPGHGDDRFGVEHYALTLQYQPRGQPPRRAGRDPPHGDDRAPGGRARPARPRGHLAAGDRRAGGPLDAPRRHASGSACRTRSPAGVRARGDDRLPGPPRTDARPRRPAGWEELTDGVLVAAQPHGAPTWFPCNDRMADKATYRVTVRTDPGYRVVSNGTPHVPSAGSGAGSSGCTSSPSRCRPTSPRCRSGATPSSTCRRHPLLRSPRPRPGCRPSARRSPTSPGCSRSSPGCSVPTPSTVHGRRHRRPPRDPAGVADPVDLRHQPPDPGLGRPAAHRPRARAPVVRQHRHRRVAARHLAARGLRLLRRVALVGGDRAAPPSQEEAERAPRPARPAAPGPRPDRPRPQAHLRRPRLQARGPRPAHAAAVPWVTTSSSRCCAPGSPPTASASSRRPTSRMLVRAGAGPGPVAALRPWLHEEALPAWPPAPYGPLVPAPTAAPTSAPSAGGTSSPGGAPSAGGAPPAGGTPPAGGSSSTSTWSAPAVRRTTPRVTTTVGPTTHRPRTATDAAPLARRGAP